MRAFLVVEFLTFDNTNHIADTLLVAETTLRIGGDCWLKMHIFSYLRHGSILGAP